MSNPRTNEQKYIKQSGIVYSVKHKPDNGLEYKARKHENEYHLKRTQKGPLLFQPILRTAKLLNKMFSEWDELHLFYGRAVTLLRKPLMGTSGHFWFFSDDILSNNYFSWLRKI